MLIFIINLFIFYLPISIILYHLFCYYFDYFSLKSYPGPFLAKFSRVWLAKVSRNGKRYLSIHEAHLKFGKFSMIRIAPDEISIADKDAIQPVLGHGNGNTKSEFYDAFVSIHRGLFNTRDRIDHTRKRKLISNTFSQKNVLEFEPYISSTLHQFLIQWDRLCDQVEKPSIDWYEFDSLPWFNYLAFDIIGDLAFGEPFGMIQRAADYAEVDDGHDQVLHLPAVQILNERGEYSMTQGCLPSWIRPITPYLDPWFARGATSVSNLAGIARNRVKKRLEGGPQDRKDLLARLQEGTDANGQPMGRDELTAEALTQLIAGSDTTSNSSCAILWWIVKHPNVHKKLVEELNTKFENPSIGVIEFIDCKDLKYLNACINEGLRRHSTSSIGLPRLMANDLNFKGFFIKKGTVVSVPSYEIHHDPEVWGDPWNFRPERWLEPDAKELEKAFMPFSFGPRSCVGRNVAILELQMIISTLVLRYDFQLSYPNQSELETREGFLRKPTECFIKIKRRLE
ncbi:uncharacterized protein MELLADRAFT_36399 [Melampsora larici-populina 98AG31]|uniref:Cytochrome P450 monooxygenase n=1 Tax=Melampsora larici-populina (strain 98AG31 / pathotype 3-4-7) TaxID=747676 RepID=F4RNN1_MELLP|nr:uncharacterized protein MELLADRAFT_36399 [Melampsora larici-populina 98AG31]EGG06012.1 hypothetical protein MELLADRAFT_36399 [Melampsora larici-populina 98AG31]